MKNEFPDESIFVKIQTRARSIKKSVLYPAFVLGAVLRKTTTPILDKAVIVSAIGYLFLRHDLINDVIPVLGYADDVAALLYAISHVSRNVNSAVEAEAQASYEDYFGEHSDTVS